jgi:hypothetical protein
MNAREGRTIMFGLVAGATLGGLLVLMGRVRAGRRVEGLLKEMVDGLNWQEVLGLSVAAIGIAKRIGSLVEAPDDSEG